MVSVASWPAGKDAAARRQGPAPVFPTLWHPSVGTAWRAVPTGAIIGRQGVFALDNHPDEKQAPGSDPASLDQRQLALHAAWHAERQAAMAAPATRAPTVPAAAAWLAFGAVLPLVALCAGALDGGLHADFFRAALFGYGAVLLGFTGALHGGIALAVPGLAGSQRIALFGWSMVPALLAWPALLLYARPALLLLLLGYAFQYGRDRWLVLRGGAGAFLPAWYLPLRLRFTLATCACLAFGGW